MTRSLGSVLRGVVAAVVAVLALASPAAAGAQEAPPAPPPPPPPRAWVLVDADTGAVVEGGNERQPMRVASVFKVLTALVVIENLDITADVPISVRAQSMPARKMQLEAGEVWKASDLLHALLLVSANDAAVALAERTGGSLEGFAGMLVRTAERLGLSDTPLLKDPAGLDDEFSVDGGNLISARDLAIAARAFLAYEDLVRIVGVPEFRFTGGDGAPHRLLNHNRLLKTYPGAIGLKTGYTKRAGHSLLAAAQRDGRTMIAVVVGAADPYRSASLLLDKGFGVPVSAQAALALDHLPDVVLGDAREPETGAAPAPEAVSTPAVAVAERSALVPTELLLLLGGGGPGVAILVRRRRLGRAHDPRSRIRPRAAA